MTNIQSIQSNRNIPSFSQLSKRTGHRRGHSLQAFIVSSVEGSVAFYAAVIYSGKSPVHCLEGWIDGGTAEKAWLQAYQMAYEWRDVARPKARLFVSSIEERQQFRGTRAAA